MADRFSELGPKHIEFIEKQHLYFVATAGAEGSVNLSPKGMDSLRVLNNQRVVWLNLTGSGNETAAHIAESSRMTLMFCSFDKQPLILRLYGQAKTIHARDDVWRELVQHFPSYTGARQVFDLDIELVQTSCGFAVPYYDLVGERETLSNWTEKTGRAGIEAYWKRKNVRSLDDKATGIVED